MKRFFIGLSVASVLLSLPVLATAMVNERMSEPTECDSDRKIVIEYCYVGSMMHNVLKRSLSGVIHTLQDNASAVIVEPKTDSKGSSNYTLKPDFKGYLKSYLLFMQSHRKIETEHGFPLARNLGLSFPDSFDSDHDDIGVKLGLLDQSIQLGFQSQESLISQLQELETMVTKHFNDEEMTTTFEALVAANISDAAIIEFNKNAEAVTKKFDPTLVLPFLYYNLAEEERVRFWEQTFPWFVRRVLFPILKVVKGSYWKFATFPSA